jgi:AcrR family transcriptional regulator
MAVKNNTRTIITRRILKESLLELMQEKPVSKISIKEICDLSEMSRSTFYLHYQDQFELLADIEKEVLEKTFENLRKIDSPMNTMESKYVQESAPEIDEIPTARYVYTFIMYGSLNVIKTWIENGFDADIHALAEVIYHSCNNIARSQA